MKTYHYPFYPAVKPVFMKRQQTSVRTWTMLAKGLLPTLFVLIVAELVVRFTGSGYSVVVIMLLVALLYSTYRYGTSAGILSSIVIGLYNFYVVALILNISLFDIRTLQSGTVIAVAFPVVAYVIGRLKSRNDALLQREQDARVKAEESARQMQFMAESMPEKIFTTLPNGKHVYMNSQWSDYIDPTKQALAEWGTIVHPRDYAKNMRLWEKALSEGTPFEIEHRLKRSDGVYVWHLTRAQPLRNKKGNITLWVGSTTDIEEVRRTKKLKADTARLKRQHLQLMELNKAKDEFISLASHQLRTPATAVKQYVNMALDGYAGKLTPQLRSFLDKADQNNERQLSIINDLLQVAQIDSGKVVLRKERVDVQSMILSVLHDQQSMFDARKQTVEFTPKQQKMIINADPTKLRMVIENVIDNASKYSYENTVISIAVTKYRGKLRISVKDQGVGINKGDAEKVFEKFMRLDNPLSTVVGGNGLGLYWVRKVVELHKGTISVTPHTGDGVTFTITLPATVR
ncbi:MAG: sensor histidine kinase [Patescibacteria group bacterium]|nr:sensor histidine kinase [Patescibacteria group bacterium]